ncbi:thiol-disulfide oxidoreductase ResA [Bacillus taeanensis]|uniref:Thiol-disulfide oxidoreductase n=1 Tax=Bacillus taeanensis TaxID=273032 RepID=A0A366Y2A4_9BACI|nr:thiol-disulfide oxidoreductase ResA [Bacillus taeanensis]RBW70341.1 thiol-disulfide oxidoreductase [Bacillus taeanensis]
MKKNRLIMRTSILVIIAIALGYTFFTTFLGDAHSPVKIGDQAPSFVLTDMNGKTVELEDYRGKGVFLNFWATYCEPCKAEMPAMDKNYQKYKDEGVEILAVNVNEPELTARRFVERYSLSFPILLDKSSEVFKAYGVGPIPTTFLIDKDGKVVDRYTESRSEEAIAQDMEQIKP